MSFKVLNGIEKQQKSLLHFYSFRTKATAIKPKFNRTKVLFAEKPNIKRIPFQKRTFAQCLILHENLGEIVKLYLIIFGSLSY